MQEPTDWSLIQRPCGIAATHDHGIAKKKKVEPKEFDGSVLKSSAQQSEHNKFSYTGTQDGPTGSMPKGTKAIGSRTKKNKLTEDERYDPTPGGMEWGTPQGTD